MIASTPGMRFNLLRSVIVEQLYKASKTTK